MEALGNKFFTDVKILRESVTCPRAHRPKWQDWDLRQVLLQSQGSFPQNSAGHCSLLFAHCVPHCFLAALPTPSPDDFGNSVPNMGNFYSILKNTHRESTSHIKCVIALKQKEGEKSQPM